MFLPSNLLSLRLVVATILSGAFSMAQEDPFPSISEAPPKSLLPNGSFTWDANGDGWPDGWSRTPQLQWKQDPERDFLRLGPGSAGTIVSLQRIVRIPAGTQAFDFVAVVRALDIQSGAQPWHDARIVLQFRNANDANVKGGPPPFVISRKGSTDWRTIRKTFPAPPGAAYIECTVALFNTPAGEVDIDLLDLRPLTADPAAPSESGASFGS